MRESKRKKLEAKGWKVGSAAEFLGLNQEESAYIEMKLRLSHALRLTRQARHLTQAQLARLVRSSQSRIAKMEACDSTVSLDLLVKTLLALGTSPKELAKVIVAPLPEAA